MRRSASANGPGSLASRTFQVSPRLRIAANSAARLLCAKSAGRAQGAQSARVLVFQLATRCRYAHLDDEGGRFLAAHRLVEREQHRVRRTHPAARAGLQPRRSTASRPAPAASLSRSCWLFRTAAQHDEQPAIFAGDSAVSRLLDVGHEHRSGVKRSTPPSASRDRYRRSAGTGRDHRRRLSTATTSENSEGPSVRARAAGDRRFLRRRRRRRQPRRFRAPRPSTARAESQWRVARRAQLSMHRQRHVGDRRLEQPHLQRSARRIPVGDRRARDLVDGKPFGQSERDLPRNAADDADGSQDRGYFFAERDELGDAPEAQRLPGAPIVDPALPRERQRLVRVRKRSSVSIGCFVLFRHESTSGRDQHLREEGSRDARNADGEGGRRSIRRLQPSRQGRRCPG